MANNGASKGDSYEDQTVDKEIFQCLLGKLIYLSNTRTNISIATNLCTPSPSNCHRESVKRIMKYLKAPPRRGLFFKKQGGRDIFFDADWVGYPNDRHSTSRY